MRTRFFTHAALVLGTFVAGSTGLAQTPVSAILLPSPEAKRADLYGDPLPAEALVRLGTLRWRHSAMVVFSHYLPDGKGLLTASQDGTIRVWDVDSGKEIRHFGTLPKGPVIPQASIRSKVPYRVNQLSSVAVSPDGKTLVTATQNVFLTFWDVASGAQQRQVRASANNGILSLTFAPDGKSVAYMSYDQHIRLVNVADGKELRKLGGPVLVKPNGLNQQIFFGRTQSSPLTFSTDGKLLLAAAREYGQNVFNSIVRRWEVETSKELKPIYGPRQMSFRGVAFSPDGISVAWACNDNSARITDLVTGKELRNIPGPAMSYIFDVAFTRDGQTLITRHGDQTLRLWDPTSGKELRSLYAGYAASNSALSPDGKRLATGTSGNTVRQWELATGKEIGEGVGHHGAVANLAVSPDGKTVASRSADNLIHLWDAVTGKEISHFGLDGRVRVAQVAFSHDLAVAAAGSYDGILRLYNTRTGKETRQWKAHQSGFVSLAISPNDKFIASRAYDQVIHLWDLATGTEIRQIVPPGASTAANGVFLQNPMSPQLAFSPDGSMLLGMIGNNGFYNSLRSSMPARVNSTLLLWDVATGRLLRRFDPAKTAIASAVFAPDGRTVATANYDGSLSLWETASGKQRFQFKTSGNGPVTVLSFTPNGKMLVGGDPQTHAVRFWDVLTGKELAAFQGHQGYLTSLVLADDGKKLISGSNDTTALIWDATRPDKALQPLPPVEVDSARAEALWNDLAAADAKKAFDAMRTLIASSDAALPVRPVAPPDPQRLARLIADLNSNQFAVRQKATEELEKLAELAADALQKVIAGRPSLETRKRAEQLLERLVTGQSLPTEELRKLRAVEVLELQGTDEARDLLAQLASGARSSRITRQAQAALRRLAKE